MASAKTSSRDPSIRTSIHVFKPTLKQGFRPILQKTTREQGIQAHLRRRRRPDGARTCPVPPERSDADSRFRDDDILTLARWACIIEDHYRREQRQAHAHGYGMGQGRDKRENCSSSRRGRKRSNRAATAMSLESYRLKRNGAGSRQRAQCRREDRAGPVHVIKSAHTSANSRRAKFW